MVEFVNVGLNVLYKAASLQGLSYHVFVAYFSAVATLVLFLCSLFFNRDVELPQNRLCLLLRILHLGLTGYVLLLCMYAGVMYSFATLASAMSNLAPALTFVLAITFRMENPAWKSQSTQAKIAATAISIAGACVVTFYKGPIVVLSTPPTPNPPLYQLAELSISNWVVGGLLLATQYLLISVWYIFQTQAVKIYPAEIRLVFFYFLSVTVVSSMVGLVVERNLSAWELGVGINLAAVIYAGLFSYSMGTVIHTGGLRLKGPVYVAMFRPLSIAIAAIMSAIFLGESLHLGSVIGSVIISAGFYTVLWGKAREEKGEGSKESLSMEAAPLLQSVAYEGDAVVR